MKPKKPAKYRNIRTVVDGIVFDSKKEANHYSELKLLMKAGEVAWFCRQVSFDLPGGIKYKADFVVAFSQTDFVVTFADGDVYQSESWPEVIIEDVKPFDKKTGKFRLTPEFKLKQKLMRSTYGIEIRLI